MVDLLEQAATWLDTQRQTHLTRKVTYRRGSDSVELDATVGSTVFRFDDASGGGASIRVVSRDYLVTAADLELAGQPTLPMRGDQVVETHGEQTITHEVLAPNAEPEWRYSDPFRRTLRIHTKQTGVTTS